MTAREREGGSSSDKGRSLTDKRETGFSEFVSSPQNSSQRVNVN